MRVGQDTVGYTFVLQTLRVSDVFGEQKSGSGRVWGLLFGVGSGSGINISGTSPLGFRFFFKVKLRIG